jgi:hypothetical protein
VCVNLLICRKKGRKIKKKIKFFSVHFFCSSSRFKISPLRYLKNTKERKTRFGHYRIYASPSIRDHLREVYFIDERRLNWGDAAQFRRDENFLSANLTAWCNERLHYKNGGSRWNGNETSRWWSLSFAFLLCVSLKICWKFEKINKIHDEIIIFF